MRFQDKVVAVTGASRGIGRSIAEAFAAEGARVACIATTQAGADSAAASMGGTGFTIDMSDKAAVQAGFAAIEEKLGPVEILINNAGITRDTLALRMSEDDWDRVLDVNLKGAFLGCQAVMKGMMKLRRGRIVNISSIVGLTGAAGQANYAASKAGVFGMTYSLAKELGARNITVNAVAPGFIETDMTAELDETMREWVKSTAPLGRLGSPDDIAQAVLFLASDAAGYITGQILTVDGGLTI